MILRGPWLTTAAPLEDHNGSDSELLALEDDTSDNEGDSLPMREEFLAARTSAGLTPASSRLADTTIVFGNMFHFVLRNTAPLDKADSQPILSYYVDCPLHKSNRVCSKSMRLNKPNQDTVIRRLKWWCIQGLYTSFQQFLHMLLVCPTI